MVLEQNKTTSTCQVTFIFLSMKLTICQYISIWGLIVLIKISFLPNIILLIAKNVLYPLNEPYPCLNLVFSLEILIRRVDGVQKALLMERKVVAPSLFLIYCFCMLKRVVYRFLK